MKSPQQKFRAAMGALALLTMSLAASASAPYGRYVINTDTVVDTETQLTWQKVAPSSTYTASQAVTYCQQLSLGGFSAGGWRLPNVRELQTLVDETTTVQPVYDTSVFPVAGGTEFWSSTPWNENPTDIFYVDFYDGSSNWNSPSQGSWVRCVH
jgi:hypothetical protein